MSTLDLSWDYLGYASSITDVVTYERIIMVTKVPFYADSKTSSYTEIQKYSTSSNEQ